MLPQIPQWLRLQLHTLPAAREGFLLPREQEENPLQSCSPFSHTPAFPMGMGLFQRHGSSAGTAARQPAAVCWGGLQKGFWLAVLFGCGCSALGLKLMWQHGAELRWVGLQPPWGLGCPQRAHSACPLPEAVRVPPQPGRFPSLVGEAVGGERLQPQLWAFLQLQSAFFPTFKQSRRIPGCALCVSLVCLRRESRRDYSRRSYGLVFQEWGTIFIFLYLFLIPLLQVSPLNHPCSVAMILCDNMPPGEA